MDSGSIIALSQQKALYRAMEVVSQNLANIGTVGYKAERACFNNHIQSAGVSHDHFLVKERALLRDFAEGTAKFTGNPLHLMIHGAGFFPIQTQRGTRYTRCGVFEVNAQSEIVTAAGDPLLDKNGEPIVIPEGTKAVDITSDGVVFADQHPIAYLCAYTFEDDQALLPEGHNLFSSEEDDPSVNEKAEFHQGMLEQANVNPIFEMMRMIEVSRRFQEIQYAMDTHKERQENAIDRIIKIV
ncbi:MAG: flagellar hook-basal body complex protein [Holosporales bacterium]|jgi:flagellar basal-body rod protein FlgF|nr:flagellar hook-basal body complex protein [Holosporales bacterium]